MNVNYRPSEPANLRVIANPFDYAPWKFYVVHTSGQILGYSNSEEWCEQLIRTVR